MLGSWRFLEEDFDLGTASWKLQQFDGGHQVLRNLWVEGTTFVMKRRCVADLGPIADGQSFPRYCIELGRRGWVNGYYYPFVRYQNLDDPRVPFSMIRSDADLSERLPLSARANGVATVEEWTRQIQRSAETVQTAQFDPKYYTGWRHMLTKLKRRVRRVRGDRSSW